MEQPLSVWESHSQHLGHDGTLEWMDISFPTAKGSGLYEMMIPAEFAEADEFYIKIDTGLTGNVVGFSWSGWALAAEEASLTGYEKWLLSIYGDLLKTEESAPDSIAKDGSYSNLLTYAFNLPPYQKGSFSGMPVITRDLDSVNEVIITIVRARDLLGCGIAYTLLTSNNLEHWEPQPDGFAEVILESNDLYERVQMTLTMTQEESSKYFRVGVEVRSGSLP